MTSDVEQARSRVAGLSGADASELRRHLEAIARPRMTGTEGAAEVEATLRERFDAMGYEAESLDFEFSTWPGRYGLPLSGAVLLLTGILGGWLVAADAPTGALIVLVAGLALALLPLFVLARAIRSLPWGRVEAVNLLFRKPGTRPAWIVMAHRDTKSQLVPTALRTAALVLAGLSWLALVVLAALEYGGDMFHFPTAAIVVGVVLALSGLSLALSWAANASPGALDNGSGLAAVLAVAERAGDSGDVAFLLTDGEELGLAGARDVAGRLPAVQGVINVEGMDDDGAFIVAEGRGWDRRGSAPQLAAALLMAGRALDLPVHRRPLPRALLVDHLPIAEAGIPALTLFRGTWSSLLRVHRPADDASALRCTGAAEGATLLAAALHLLREDGSPHLARSRRTEP